MAAWISRLEGVVEGAAADRPAPRPLGLRSRHPALHLESRLPLWDFYLSEEVWRMEGAAA